MCGRSCDGRRLIGLPALLHPHGRLDVSRESSLKNVPRNGSYRPFHDVPYDILCTAIEPVMASNNHRDASLHSARHISHIAEPSTSHVEPPHSQSPEHSPFGAERPRILSSVFG